jgi:NADH-quinone oxidoreductase subunit L
MTWPLLVLAVFALALGAINIPVDFPMVGHGWLHGFAGEVHLIAEEAAPGIAFEAVPFNWTVAIVSSILGLASFIFGWWLYARTTDAKAKDPIETVPIVGQPIFTILYNKYYFDEIYRGLLIYPTMWLAWLSAKIDYDWVINPMVNLVGRITMAAADFTAALDSIGLDYGIVNGIPEGMKWFGGKLRLLQTGRAQSYLLILVIGILVLIGLYLLFYGSTIPSIASL